MLKLMKYEYRRGLFPLLVVMIAITAAELLFLGGIVFQNTMIWAIGLELLTMGGTAVYLFVLIYGVLSYNHDIKKKSGYMVFMTPLSNYKIIGAKLLAILLTSVTLVVFLGVLIVIDYNIMKNSYEFINIVENMLRGMGTSIGERFASLCVLVLVALIQFFTMITIAYLAISLSSTVLQNKRIKDVASFLMFTILYFLINYIAYKLPALGKNASSFMQQMYYMIPQITCYVVCAVGAYIGSGVLLSKKISL